MKLINQVKHLQNELDIKTKTEKVSATNAKGQWVRGPVDIITGQCSKARAVYVASKLMDLARKSKNVQLNKAINDYQLLQNTSALRKNCKQVIINKIKKG